MQKMIPNKILAIAILVPVLILVAPNVNASRHLSDSQRYNDGYSNGSDAAARDSTYNPTCDPTGAYTSDGQHSTTYCTGWGNGYAATWNANHGGGGVSQGTPQPQPINNGQNWNGICNQIQSVLVESCSQLVNPDGSLTVPDGQKAHTCISNGIALGLGGLILTGGSVTNLPLIIGGLKILSTQTGCDGVVNWDNLDLGQLNLLRHIFR
jgi:hypothetical protein